MTYPETTLSPAVYATPAVQAATPVQSAPPPVGAAPVEELVLDDEWLALELELVDEEVALEELEGAEPAPWHALTGWC